MRFALLLLEAMKFTNVSLKFLRSTCNILYFYFIDNGNLTNQYVHRESYLTHLSNVNVLLVRRLSAIAHAPFIPMLLYPILIREGTRVLVQHTSSLHKIVSPNVIYKQCKTPSYSLSLLFFPPECHSYGVITLLRVHDNT